MLVMRNFGYLGLHTVVDKKSSLARDRLVDFTGELQLRAGDSATLGEDTKESDENDPYTLELPRWHPRFLAEPTIEGGRNCVDENSSEMKGPRSHLYAQELAPLPLQLVPSAPRVPPPHVAGAKPGVSRGRLHGNDIEPFYHISFCNELLFHPRLLHNCPRGNIVIKVELRELEWKQDINGYFAHLPANGPYIHNSRRGPFLVESAFTSCSPKRGDHHFIDEFKAKLPLDLQPGKSDTSSRTLSLFFCVYNVRLDSKSTWKRAKKKILGPNPTPTETGEPQSQETSGSSTRLEQLACGFLPLTTNSCLVDNGLHDVRVIYSARKPPEEFCDRGVLDPSTLILVDKSDTNESQASLIDESCADDTLSSSDSKSQTGFDNSENTNLSELASLADDSRSRATSNAEPISLSVSLLCLNRLSFRMWNRGRRFSSLTEVFLPFSAAGSNICPFLRASSEPVTGIVSK